MTLFKLKIGQLINLDLVTRITPRADAIDLEMAGLNLTLRDKDDIEAFKAKVQI